VKPALGELDQSGFQDLVAPFLGALAFTDDHDGRMLVTTHNLVKCVCHSVQI
jgi:hypothetical protein